MIKDLQNKWKLSYGVINWSTKRQNTIILSSTRVDYMVTTHTMKETNWPWTLLIHLGETSVEHKIVYFDNQSEIALAFNPKCRALPNTLKYIVVLSRKR